MQLIFDIVENSRGFDFHAIFMLAAPLYTLPRLHESVALQNCIYKLCSKLPIPMPKSMSGEKERKKNNSVNEFWSIFGTRTIKTNELWKRVFSCFYCPFFLDFFSHYAKQRGKTFKEHEMLCKY